MGWCSVFLGGECIAQDPSYCQALDIGSWFNPDGHRFGN